MGIYRPAGLAAHGVLTTQTDEALRPAWARHPDQRIGSLVVNYGGPGVSGVAAFIADPEPLNTVAAYLLDGVIPAADVMCPAAGAASVRASPSSSRRP
ncbi:hypothetical protein ACIBO5_26725 [Nonomuraea angiospora]|uniref:hypothetical protein n=1 Tax=Nonomuraea angiospora TaxID=46172 RepID=UPI0029AE7691|nr:hypothetical protein [Nonomuraea angiospora]MDX3102800.1 hypothetical protein [Nonomuraea angiospora]